MDLLGGQYADERVTGKEKVLITLNLEKIMGVIDERGIGVR